MIVAQLVEQLLPTSEIRSLNPFIGKFYLLSFLLKTALKKTRIKKKGHGMARLKTVIVGLLKR